MTLRLVADDLTGALDAAAPFAGACGAPLPVTLHAPPEAGGFDADTREGPEHAARARAAALASWLRDGRPAFRKLDSLWRGHAAAELGASGFATVVVAPAFPAQGRRTRQGRLVLPDGRTGLDLAAALRIAGLAPRLAPAGEAPQEAGLWLCDAETEADLAALAMARPPPPVLWAGSGGLARALAGPGRPPAIPTGPPLLLCGSPQPLAQAVLAALPPAAQRHPATTAEAAGDAAWAAARVGAGLPAALSLRAAGAPAVVWRALGEALARGAPPGLLCVIGGRSLRDLCAVLGVQALEVAGEVRPGLPLSTLRGGAWDGVALVSRSGGFDDRRLLHHLMHRDHAAA